MPAFKAIVIRSDAPPRIQAIATADEARNIIGGWLEGVRIQVPGDAIYAYVNEDGRSLGLRPNPYATMIARNRRVISFDDVIRGPMILFGGVDVDGNERDAGDEAINEVLLAIHTLAETSPHLHH